MEVRRVNSFQEGIPDLRRTIERRRPRLVRIEGAMAVGKTPLTNLLAHTLCATAVHCDCFQCNLGRSEPHPDQMNLEGFRSHLKWCLERSPLTIVEGICLEELAPLERFERGFLIYIKRISASGLWHGFDEFDEAPTCEWHRSIHRYHSHHRPHESADFLIEVPAEGHKFGTAEPASDEN